MQRFVVPEESNGKRIDLALSEIMGAYSRSQVQRLIREDCIRIDGHSAKKGNRVSKGQVIEVSQPLAKKSRFLAFETPLEILFEDDDLLVVNKPAGLLTHPSAHERKKTLVNALIHHCGDRLSGIGGEKRPGIVHRLDKDTSGILLVAKHDESHKDLSKQMEQRSIEKHYLGLVLGLMSGKQGSIEAPLISAQNRKGQKVIVSPHPFGKAAITKFSVIETFDEKYSLLDIEILTGRMHQIRVHMASIYHPIIGDPVYGNTQGNEKIFKLGLKRQFLHSHQLRFEHPRTHEIMTFRCGLPKELEEVLEKLRQHQL